MAKTHLLSCLHPECGHVMIVAAGDLPARCPNDGCRREGWWQIDRVMIWSVQDLKLLRHFRIAAD